MSGGQAARTVRASREGDGVKTHGKAWTYRHGCRCDECRQANTLYQRRLLGRPAPSHGVSGYFNYRCRCDVCRAAGSVKNRENRERRLARQAGAA